MIDLTSPDALSDDELVEAVSTVLAIDRTLDNSFVLHAPLELLARADLLAAVGDDARAGARARLVSMAEIHAASGEPIALPTAGQVDAAGLLEAIEAGDVERADELAMAAVARHSADEVSDLLAAPTLRSAAAAAHAPILFGNWARTAAQRPVDPRFVRGIVRRLTAGAGLRFELPHPNDQRVRGSIADLDTALRRIPALGSPGWGIFLLVHQAETSGAMAAIPAVDPSDIVDAFRTMFRVAASSMVLDDPSAAPYEWTHCLSLPMGLWQSRGWIDDPLDAVDIALTHVVGFRAAYGDGELGVYAPADPERELAEALDDGPAAAAAAAFHADAAGSLSLLIDRAAVEHDAHLVKYVHAVRDAIAMDPAATPLYLAAAAFLVAWWREHPPADDPLR